MKRMLLVLVATLSVLVLTACDGREERAMAPVQPAVAETVETVAVEDATLPKGAVDLDLTQMSGTVVYSQVYQMMVAPETYMGSTIRMRGALGYYQDPETQKEYFAAVIQDATACCAQGIEFVWRGEHRYPDDYPPLDTEVTVTGIFDTYEEDGGQYIQLVDAEVTWDDRAA